MKIWTDLSSVLHACDKRTDGQTDRIVIPIACSAVKMKTKGLAVSKVVVPELVCHNCVQGPALQFIVY